METRKIVAIFLTVLIMRTGFSHAEETERIININTEVMVIALPNAQTLQFTSGHNLNASPADGLKKLRHLVDLKLAVSAANFSVTSNSGQVATSKAGTTKLEVESIMTPGKIQVNIAFGYNGKKITTSFDAQSGEVKFLGAFDSTDPAKQMTDLVFARIRAPKPAPSVAGMYDVTVSIANEAGKDVSKMEYLPVIVTVKNKSNSEKEFLMDRWDLDKGVSIYSVDESGKETLVVPDLTKGPILSSGMPLKVTPGKTNFLNAKIPMALFGKYGKLAVSVEAWPNREEIFSKPFAFSDLK